MLQAPVQLEGCWLVCWGCSRLSLCFVACRRRLRPSTAETTIVPKSHPHAGLAPVRTDVMPMMRCSSKKNFNATKNTREEAHHTTTAQPLPTHLQHKKGIIYEGRVCIQNELRDINLTVCGGVSGHESLLCISCRRRRRLGNSSQIS